jgi:hypothetical protein
MIAAALARRGNGKIHWVGKRYVDDPAPEPGTVMAERPICGRVDWHDDWVVVDRQWMRDLPDAGESLMCRWCD